MDYGLNSIQSTSQLAMQKNSMPRIDANAEDKALREQTDAFESVIIKMLLDNSMKDDNDLFASQKDPGDKIYKSMYRDELSKASAGSFGFSQMLYDYLSQKKS
jgi:Rod binding domain-containing protein